MVRDAELIQRQHFCNHGNTICHPKSGYVTATKLHGTYVYVSNCRCSNDTIFSDRSTFVFSSFLPSTYAGHVNLAAGEPWQFMPNGKDGGTVEFIVYRV